MVPLRTPGGVEVMASDEDAPRLLANGYVRMAEPKPKPKRRAPRKAQKPQDK
jgi:hypothetical protein